MWMWVVVGVSVSDGKNVSLCVLLCVRVCICVCLECMSLCADVRHVCSHRECVLMSVCVCVCE